MKNYRFRIVSRLIQEASPYGAGILVARFEKPFILLSIAYSNNGIVDFLAHDHIVKAPADPMTAEQFLLYQAQKNPYFFDQTGDIGKLALLNLIDIDVPVNDEQELHVQPPEGATQIVITYLERL